MPAEIFTDHRNIRRRRDGSLDHDFYRSRALRRKALVHRAIMRRCFATLRSAVAACVAASGKATASSWRGQGARRAGVATLAIALAAASQALAQPSGQGHGAGGHVMVVPSELKWASVPSLPSGAEIAVIQGPMNEAKPFTAQLKFPANYKIPPHSHPAIEHVTVISGVFHMGLGGKFDAERARPLPAGSVAIMQPGTNHFAWTSLETIVQLHGVGPWGVTYVNPADDPRAK